MTGKKLTPRVGDRVIVSPNRAIPSNRSYLGYVRNVQDDFGVLVEFDPPIERLTSAGSGHTTQCRVSATYLTVVDREPVEWPEGWNNRSSVRTNVVIVPDAGDYSVTLSREGFNRIRGPEGDYVAEHWDELVGDQ